MRHVFQVSFGFSISLIAEVALFTNASHAATTYDLSGKVIISKVSDGDSLRSGNLRIRIFGIDAPELKQQCQERSGISWACGIDAQQKLESLIGANKTLYCALQDVDRYGRLVMKCFQGAVDIGAAMVRSGHALAYRAFSELYVTEEQQARSTQHGVWRGTFITPWEWRRKN